MFYETRHASRHRFFERYFARGQLSPKGRAKGSTIKEKRRLSLRSWKCPRIWLSNSRRRHQLPPLHQVCWRPIKMSERSQYPAACSTGQLCPGVVCVAPLFAETHFVANRRSVQLSLAAENLWRRPGTHVISTAGDPVSLVRADTTRSVAFGGIARRRDRLAHWLWSSSVPMLAYLAIDRLRSSPALQKFFIREISGALVSDL